MIRGYNLKIWIYLFLKLRTFQNLGRLFKKPFLTSWLLGNSLLLSNLAWGHPPLSFGREARLEAACTGLSIVLQKEANAPPCALGSSSVIIAETREVTSLRTDRWAKGTLA